MSSFPRPAIRGRITSVTRQTGAAHDEDTTTPDCSSGIGRCLALNTGRQTLSRRRTEWASTHLRTSPRKRLTQLREAFPRRRWCSADGIPIVERDDKAAYTAFKCLDPDGHRIEVYWEPPFSQ